MSEIVVDCPYCGEESWQEIENMDETEVELRFCLECHEEFEFRISYSVDGYASKRKNVANQHQDAKTKEAEE